MKKIDARGLSCPAPVLETKAAVEASHPQTIEVLVDNEPAQQNVTRYLNTQGYQTEIRQEGTLFTIFGTGGDAASAPASEAVEPTSDAKKSW